MIYSDIGLYSRKGFAIVRTSSARSVVSRTDWDRWMNRLYFLIEASWKRFVQIGGLQGHQDGRTSSKKLISSCN